MKIRCTSYLNQERGTFDVSISGSVVWLEALYHLLGRVVKNRGGSVAVQHDHVFLTVRCPTHGGQYPPTEYDVEQVFQRVLITQAELRVLLKDEGLSSAFHERHKEVEWVHDSWENIGLEPPEKERGE